MERVGALSVLRIGFCIATGLVTMSAATPAASPKAIGVATAGYALVIVLAAIAAAKLSRTRALAAVAGSLLADGAYIWWVISATGGLESPLLALPAIHVIAVTLIASYRTGLKVALWHSLLVFVAAYGQRAQLAIVPTGIPTETVISLWSLLIRQVAPIWAVGLVTAAFSGMKERELRSQKIHLEQLSSMVRRLHAADDAAQMPQMLLDALVDAFAFTRGAALARRGDDLVVVAAYGTADVTGRPVGPDDVMELAWAERRPVLRRSLDAYADSRLAELLPDARNVMVVPLLSRGGAALGILALETPGRSGRIRRWVVAVVEQFAAHAALSLHTAWLLEELQDRLDENRVLQLQLASQNERLEEAVAERTQELSESLRQLHAVDGERRRLLRKLVDAQEDERHRLAGDIHDDPVQKMVAVSMWLQMLARQADAPDLVATLEKLIEHVKASITSMRHLIFELRPSVLDDEGLAPALQELMDKVGDGLVFRLRNQLIDEPPPETRVILYRIAQEALANVRKHARAESVDVLLLPQGDGFLVRITDDGGGFHMSHVPASAPGHLGLTSMRERAEMAGGWWKLQSVPEMGTTVEFWLPAVLSVANGGASSPDAQVEPEQEVSRAIAVA
jgi:signal transduction histidine kinase